jgi:predicted porin
MPEKKMKKIMLMSFILAASSVSAAGPTLYGKVNKEFRYIDQKTEAKYQKLSGITGVDDTETRFGFKGSHELSGSFDAAYKLEAGFNSFKDAGGTDTIRIRQANVVLKSNYGDFIFGQTDVPYRKEIKGMDPFDHSGLSAGCDLDDIQGRVATTCSFYDRSRQDLVGYKTPNFAGFNYTLTIDRDNTAMAKTSSTATWYSNLLTYSKEFGVLKLRLHGSYNLEDQRNTDSKDANKFWDTGAKLGYLGATFGLNYMKRKLDRVSGARVERDYYLGAFSYKFGDFTAGLTYAEAKFDGDEVIGATGSKGGEQTRISTGILYSFNKHVSTRLLYGNHVTKVNSGKLFSTRTDNKSHIILTGITLGF